MAQRAKKTLLVKRPHEGMTLEQMREFLQRLYDEIEEFMRQTATDIDQKADRT